MKNVLFLLAILFSATTVNAQDVSRETFKSSVTTIKTVSGDTVNLAALDTGRTNVYINIEYVAPDGLTNVRIERISQLNINNSAAIAALHRAGYFGFKTDNIGRTTFVANTSKKVVEINRKELETVDTYKIIVPVGKVVVFR